MNSLNLKNYIGYELLLYNENLISRLKFVEYSSYEFNPIT